MIYDNLPGINCQNNGELVALVIKHKLLHQ